jgi:hypothetical protein
MSAEARNVLSGAIAGVVAGIAASVVTLFAVEPHIEAAIAFEEALAHTSGGDHSHEVEVVSRGVQASVGVFTSVGLFGAAIGIAVGVAAYALGRMIPGLSMRMQAVTATALAFMAGFLVPYLVYPSNPPAVGSDATLMTRTAMYYAIVGISLIAVMSAVVLARALSKRLGWWESSVVAFGAYLVVVVIAGVLLPTRTELNGGVNEIPEGFPAGTLADFRIGSLLVAVTMYAVILVVLPAVQGRMARRAGPSQPERQADRVPGPVAF